MRRRADRSLHVLLSAPLAVLVAAASAPLPRVHAESADAAPAPVVVCLDPGHGGSPDDAHPERPYDSGAVAVNGLLEKDIVLDMARRVRTLLQADDVSVVLTRDSDVFLDIPAREQRCNDAHADLMTAIHMNGFQDAGVEGSVVLFPNASDRSFAVTMASSLSRALAPLGVQSLGTMLRDNWWIHAQMPVVTLEPLFITNTADAQLISRGDVRDRVARAVRDGLEAYDPAIQQRRAAIEAWRAAHTAAPTPSPAATGSAPAAVPGVGVVTRVDSPEGGPPIVPLAASAALLLAAVAMLRRPLYQGAATGSARFLSTVARIEGRAPPAWLEALARGRDGPLPRRRGAARLQTSQERRRRLIERGREVRGAGRTVYGEVWD